MEGCRRGVPCVSRSFSLTSSVHPLLKLRLRAALHVQLFNTPASGARFHWETGKLTQEHLTGVCLHPAAAAVLHAISFFTYSSMYA